MASSTCSSFSSLNLTSMNATMTSEQTRSEDIAGQLQFFWKNQMYTDITFHVACGEGYLPFCAHSLVLSMRSSVLARLIAEHQSPIKISDVLPSAFEAILRFMYGITPIDRRDLSDVNYVLKVYKAATLYQVPYLSKLCVDSLTFIFPSLDTVFDLLNAARETGSKLLEERCNKFLQTKTHEILSFMSAENITYSMVMMILDMPTISFREPYDLISWALSWIQGQTDDIKQNILAKILPDILRTSPHHFNKLVTDYPSIFTVEDGFSIFMNIVEPGSWALPSWSQDPLNATPRKYSWDFD